MPLYEYICGSCGKTFDKIVRSPDTPDSAIECRHCGKSSAKRKLSTFSFGSRSKGGDFIPSPSSGGCSSCTSHNCSSCGG